MASAPSATTFTLAQLGGGAGGTATEDPLSEDFGYRPPASASFQLGGRLFHDFNGNGVDNTENGFQNVSMELQKTGVTITNNTAANPTVITTSAPHGLYPGSVVTINTTVAAINGTRIVTATPTANTFTVTLGAAPAAGATGYFDYATSTSGTITSNTAANPTVVTTSAAHGFPVGSTVTVVISGNSSIPTINGTRTATITGATTFTVPVQVTTAGAGGTYTVSASALTIGFTTTNSTGNYSFTGLAPGRYTVRFTDVNGVLAGFTTTYEKSEGPWIPGPVTYNGLELPTIVAANIMDLDFGFYQAQQRSITQAVVSSFLAREVGGAMALEWRTASEVGTIGFFVRRWDEKRNEYVDVSEKLLPALIKSRTGGVYRFVDPDAVPGFPYRYELVEVEGRGRATPHGPYNVDTHATALARIPAPQLEATAIAGYSMAANREEAATLRARRNLSARDAVEDRSTPLQSTPLQAVGGEAAKVGVTERGIYFVSFDDLRTQAGLTASWPDLESGYTFSQAGRRVAVTRAPGDGFLFFGEANPTVFSRDNVYRLARGGDPTLLMAPAPPSQAPMPTGAETYLKSLHVEKNVFAAADSADDPDADYWMWDYLVAGLGPSSYPFRADGVNPAGGAATLSVRLRGASDTPTNPDHHVRISLNGNALGEVRGDGVDVMTATFEIDASMLVEGNNVLQAEALPDTGAPYSVVYVDSFDLGYRSFYRAAEDRAEVPAGGNASLFITGFTRRDIQVLEITDPRRPRVVGAATVMRASDGTWGVALPTAAPKAVYYAATRPAFRTPSRIVQDRPSTLRSRNNRAEYLVVATRSMARAARQLVEYRSDLAGRVVDIEDVYDEFNYGIASPYALKAFLAAAATWLTPPRYVVLAGDGSYDYKDYLGLGDNLIPPMMVATPRGLFPSDAWFADVPLLPGQAPLSIGRLPVTSGAELLAVLEKIRVRETAQGGWLARLLLGADNADHAGDYVADSEALSGVAPSSVLVDRAYLSVLGPAAARTTFIDAINEGRGAVNYTGHGGYDVLADEGLFHSSDVGLLVNNEKPVLLTGMTCLVGNFGLPGFTGLGELLVRKETGGAVAVWSSTGMSEDDLAAGLATGFYARLYEPDVRRLGDAVAATRKDYAQTGKASYMLNLYNLLGDPAMKLH